MLDDAKLAQLRPRLAPGARGKLHTELLERLADLELAYDSAPIGLCLLDLRFRYVTVNTHFANLYGKQVADFLGRTVEQAVPEPAAQILEYLEETLASGDIVEREITLDRPALIGRGSEQGVYLRTAQPLRNASGKVIGISVALSDITARKKLISALHESEEDLRCTVELTPHIPWTADSDGEITSMSPRWHTVTGHMPRRVLLKDWTIALHPEDRGGALIAWKNSVRSGNPFDTEYRIRTADGHWRWFRARAYPRYGDRGEILRWYGTIEDINDRKTTSLQLLAATEELAQRTREDYLTALPNRRRFDEVLLHEIDRARRTKLPLALILLDIDHFKRYNDLCGHLAGDECLKAVAKTLDGVIRRPADMAARFGGEEFAIILPETNFQGAISLGQRAVDSVATLCLQNLDPRVEHVTISAGVAMLELGAESSANQMKELIERADRELYAAKAAGRNQVQPRSPEKPTLPQPPQRLPPPRRDKTNTAPRGH
jgi:diguanylate cyclase (GGDEF)-like protein/PAS domain S-box-containing protein